MKALYKSCNLYLIKLVFFITLMTSGMIACKKDVMCYQPTEATMHLGFVQKMTYEVDTFIDSILVDTTFIIYRDSLMPYVQAFYDDGTIAFSISSGEASNSIGLTLNPNDTQTKYFLSYDSTSTALDTLQIFYKNHPVFISNDCGFTNFYTINDIQINSFGVDSIHIADKEVTLDNANNKKHILIYFFKE